MQLQGETQFFPPPPPTSTLNRVESRLREQAAAQHVRTLSVESYYNQTSFVLSMGFPLAFSFTDQKK